MEDSELIKELKKLSMKVKELPLRRINMINLAEESRAFLASQLTRKEFEEKLRKFIRENLGCDLRDHDELLLYHGDIGVHAWTLNIDKDDLTSE